MFNDYGVNDIFQNIHASDAMEGYANMAVDQIDNSFFRDMYMDTMEAVLTGNDYIEDYGPEPHPMREAMEDLSDMDDMFEGCAKECGSNCSTECGGGSCESNVGDEYMYGKGSNAGDHAYLRSLNTITGTDPTDAGTFFNLKDQRPSVESAEASREMQDLISTLPDTEVIVDEGYYPDTYYEDNGVNESAELGLDDLGPDPLL